jgi:hypothetical protein
VLAEERRCESGNVDRKCREQTDNTQYWFEERLPSRLFLMYKAGTTTGDYHGQMNSGNFEKWITVQVIPNLPPSSTVVMDNAPYH